MLKSVDFTATDDVEMDKVGVSMVNLHVRESPLAALFDSQEGGRLSPKSGEQ